MTVVPPIRKQSSSPALPLTVRHAHQREPPRGCPRIEWKQINDLPGVTYFFAAIYRSPMA